MPRLRFGAFLAPHHPVGEHPTLQWQRDIELGVHLDRLGLDEYWIGEHHSSGWETIGSPEMFLVAVAERTKRIRLGTGVVSLPYHNPFMVAQRMVMLDHLSFGRAIFGTGPGALPSDALMQAIEPITQRDRQDEALGVILRLLRGEVVTAKSDWFDLREARLQVLPYQEEMEAACASSISPSGMKLAGKYGIGALSIASTSTEGLAALPTQWAFAEESAAQHGTTVDRRNWRVLTAFHLAPTRAQAIEEAKGGLQWWHNEYNVRILGRPNAEHMPDAEEFARSMVRGQGEGMAAGAGVGVIGTPDDLVEAIRDLQGVTGGFGVLLGFAHDWADREATLRSWELFARYVVPEVNGYTTKLRESAEHLASHRDELIGGAMQAILAQIAKDPKAMEAAAITFAQTGGADQTAAIGAGGPAGGFITKQA